MHFNENPRKFNKNSIEINRFRKDGWLGQGIWQAKSPKILFSKKFFSEKSGKSEKIRPIAPRAGSGQLGGARTGSAQLRTPKNPFLDPDLGDFF